MKVITEASPERNKARLMALYHFPAEVIQAFEEPKQGFDVITKLDELILRAVQKRFPTLNITSIEDERIWK